MPSGAVHLRIEAVCLACWIGVGAYLLVRGMISYPLLAWFGAAYLFSMFFLSPDLDLPQSRPFRRWGIFRWIWIPYAQLFRHRGLSHRFFLGPLSRVLYLTAIVGLFGLVLSFFDLRIAPSLPAWPLLIAIGLGLYLPNLTHIIADRIDSAWRG